jgi:glucose/arabinose dehydrogenase
MSPRFAPLALSALLLPLTAGCSQIAWQATDQLSFHSTAVRGAEAVQVPAGFRAVQVVAGLNYPSSMAWDDRGRLYVLESHTVPAPLLRLKLKRVDGGRIEEVRLRGEGAPTGERAVGIAFHDGWLYLSHDQADGSWGVSRIDPATGEAEAVVRGMPGGGDHWINHLAFAADGTLYFGVGSVTNSGVVSSHDPVNERWLALRPDLHDIPCRDLVLTGQVFAERDARTREEVTRTTGAFQPYGSSEATRVAAGFPCSTGLYRLRPGAERPELVAWGFRNPVALAVTADGEVLVGSHGADLRSTRPIFNDPEGIYRLREGAWYGWPDFGNGLEPVTAARHQPPAEHLPEGHERIDFVIDHRASGLAPPDRSLLVAATEPHAAVGGMTVVPAAGPFAAWAGRLLVSEMGDFRPITDAARPQLRAGFQVSVVDLATGERETFARNRGEGAPAPASRLDASRAFERPVDVKVGPDGLVYVLDFGVFEPVTPEGHVRALPKTGRVFRIEPAAGERRDG